MVSGYEDLAPVFDLIFTFYCKRLRSSHAPRLLETQNRAQWLRKLGNPGRALFVRLGVVTEADEFRTAGKSPSERGDDNDFTNPHR
jgi:hypothetical protein